MSSESVKEPVDVDRAEYNAYLTEAGDNPLTFEEHVRAGKLERLAENLRAAAKRLILLADNVDDVRAAVGSDIPARYRRSAGGGLIDAQDVYVEAAEILGGQDENAADALELLEELLGEKSPPQPN